jgi:hypothetical protein
MTELLCSPKIKPEHLARKAIVYLRQSMEKQVGQNQESQRLQYDLGERMHALGWSDVEIMDHDLGANVAIWRRPREGFERVLSSVALGEVGIASVERSPGSPARTGTGSVSLRCARSLARSSETSSRSMTCELPG